MEPDETTSRLAKRRDTKMTKSHITGGFWRERMDVNRTATIPAGLALCKSTGRIDAFKLEWKQGDPNPPHIFWDSDLAKWLEASALSLIDTPDAELEAQIRGIAKLVASAQQPDGYLNTHFTVVEPEKRFTCLQHWHELYCAGHLFEAAVAIDRATGDRTLLDACVRYAKLIGETFGVEDGKRRGYPGHEEIELALVKLSGATGDKSLLDLAKYFIDERGRKPHYYTEEALARGENPPPDTLDAAYAYCQAHKPVREQDRLVGHSVRATYLYCGMADIARMYGDETLAAACRKLWKHATRCMMSITGGLGQTCANEGFTQDRDLPDETAYLETCASIGLGLWAWRMSKLEPLGEYADTLERALYNGVISGLSADGKRFFYGNPLAVQPGFDGNGRYHGEDFNYRRSEWFDCACCPPNVARRIAQLPDLLADGRGDTFFIHQYACADIEAEIAGGKVAFSMGTAYPWDGEIAIDVKTCASSSKWTLALRIPGWCRNATVKVNGKLVALDGVILRNGYAYIARQWKQGDKVTLSLQMPVERIAAHPDARQTAGRVALMRGPVVYCLESVDQPGIPLADVRLADDPKFEVSIGADGVLKGVPLITADAEFRPADGWGDALYRRADEAAPAKDARITALPYFLWGNRETGAMRVWIRQ